MIDPEKFVREAGRRLNRIDTGNIVGNRTVYLEYKNIISLVEKSARAYELVGDDTKSKTYWNAVANMHLNILIGESIRGTDSTTSNEDKIQNIISGVKAAKKSGNSDLVVTIDYTAKSILKTHKGFLDNADEKLKQEVNEALSDIEKLKR